MLLKIQTFLNQCSEWPLIKQETTMGKVSKSEKTASVSSEKSKLNPMKTKAVKTAIQDRPPR